MDQGRPWFGPALMVSTRSCPATRQMGSAAKYPVMSSTKFVVVLIEL